MTALIREVHSNRLGYICKLIIFKPDYQYSIFKPVEQFILPKRFDFKSNNLGFAKAKQELFHTNC